eukprot:590845-Prymnesium_polylepis.1
MKAQACGCIPVTSGQRRSALPETCGEWDRGPTGRDGFIAGNPEWQADYLAALLAAVRTPEPELRAARARMKQAARARFSWAAVAKQWTEAFAPGGARRAA